VILKRFDQPDEIREFEKGKFQTVRIGDLVIGRATYQPGWKWSEHVSPLAGTIFYIPPAPHDSWVVGDEPYVSLHFLGQTITQGNCPLCIAAAK
jgi:hypothetical protein